jgi:hypothetical protein
MMLNMNDPADIERELRRYVLLQCLVTDEAALAMIGAWIAEANARLLHAEARAIGSRPPAATLH